MERYMIMLHVEYRNIRGIHRPAAIFPTARGRKVDLWVRETSQLLVHLAA